MKKRKFVQLTLALAMVAISTFGAISCNNEVAPVDQIQLDEDEVGNWGVSWVMGYKTFDGLLADKDMDLIAVGVIDRVIEVTEVERSKRVTTYRTAFAFKIETLLMGEEAKEVVVYQSGSPDVPSSAFSDDPIFKVGERHLLFLKENVHDSYSSIGPWGRYKIVNNKVYSLNYVLPSDRNYKPEETLDFNGLGLSAFIGDITEGLKKN